MRSCFAFFIERISASSLGSPPLQFLWGPAWLTACLGFKAPPASQIIANFLIYTLVERVGDATEKQEEAGLGAQTRARPQL